MIRVDSAWLLALVLAAAAAVAAPAAATEARWAERARGLMGTRFYLKARLDLPGQEAALDHALDRVDALERLWSPWIASSDVARVNAAGGAAVPVAAETIALASRSLALCRASGGTFDPTFFALHGLWQLDARPFRPPTPAAIRARLDAVGCHQLEIDPPRRTLRLRHPGARLHFGANAKGTALDAAAAVLREAGLRDFVVDGGGDLVVSGQGPQGPWRVGVQDPNAARGTNLGAVALGDGGVATSGDYERGVTHQGRRYHHLLDPRTGRPASQSRQVSVVVPAGPHAGEEADALATALFVLGPRQGRRWLARRERGWSAARRTRALWVDPAGTLHAVGAWPWLRSAHRRGPR